MIKLRPYQNQAVGFAVPNILENGNSLIVAGTGAGKTIMMAEVIKLFTVGFKTQYGRYPHTLVLVHRTEIHNQNLTKFKKVCPSFQTSEITADSKSVKGIVHFGMVQTVAGLIDNLPAFDMIVVDECHHSVASTYKEIIQKNTEKACKNNQKTYIFGVSATPNRLDKIPLIDLFDNFYQITTEFLIASHYLVRPEFIDLSPVFKIPVFKKGEILPIKFKNEKGCLNKNLDLTTPYAREVIKDLCQQYLKNKQPGKTVIFAPSHAFCALVFDELRALGRNPAYLSNGIADDQRAAELERFEKGDADELINVDIATEGYDYPPIRNIVEFDTNGGESQWIQKIGRGLRLDDGKSVCKVVDFGGNVGTFPNVEVSVNLEGEFKAKNGSKLTPADFFKESGEKQYNAAEMALKQEHKPYALPPGFESLNDEDYGIVFVACGQKNDAIICKNKNGEFEFFITNKKEMNRLRIGEFDNCIQTALNELSNELFNGADKPITNMQIRRLAPKHPVQTLNFQSANCLICWETWKEEVQKWKQ